MLCSTPLQSITSFLKKNFPTKTINLYLLFSFIVFYLSPIILAADDISDADRPIPMITVEGVLRHQGKLPCDVRVPTRDDKVHMVLWFRDNGEPIYRYDLRSKATTEAKRWSSLGDRVYFQPMSEPAHLLISNLQLEDEGVYRCRVDFKNSPTRNLRVRLNILVPPEKPVIYDSNGIASSSSSTIGPYNEGTMLTLVCEVYGGRPKPKVRWWLENAMIDDSDGMGRDGVVVNSMDYGPLNRLHLNARFVCQASNTNQTIPESSVVVLNMNLRPLTVTITTKDETMLADKRYDIECISTGSRPPASVTFWKGNVQIKEPAQNPIATDKNVSRSIISFIPTIDDDGKFITCRSENPWIVASAIEDRWRLNVLYPPRLSLQLGRNLVGDDIKEGADVYFECTVKSNPQFLRLSWFHEDKELIATTVPNNISQKIIMSKTSLIMQKITRHAAGSYYCSAYNTEGLSQSNIVQLRVKFVPTCKSNTGELIGAMRHETVTVRCEMASDPPNVQFSWTFNNSVVEVMPIPRSLFTFNGTVSLLLHTPSTEQEFGTLTCWGANSIGDGRNEPCHFQIVQAGKPFPPKNCSINNQTEDSLNVTCIEGFDGGLPQSFLLHVVDTQTKKIRLNISSTIPFFAVEGMESGVAFKFLIYSGNSKGISEPFVIEGITFRGVARFTGSTSTAELNPLFTILVVCSIVLIIFVTVSIIAIWKRSRRKKPPVVKSHIRRDSETNFQSAEATISKIDQNGPEDIGNPDVIPNKNGGLRGFIRIHKTPPARRRKKNLEVNYNGETVALTDEPHEIMGQTTNRKNSRILIPSTHATLPRESRI